MANIVSKLSVKSIKATPAQAKALDKKVHLARFVGIASGIKMATDNRGEPVAGLTGQFLGVNIETGEEYQSGVLYLPGGIQDIIESGVNKGELDKNDRPVYSAVEFALDIYSVPASNPIGYSYEGVPLIKAKEADPLAELLAKAGETFALPTPGEAKKK